MPLKKIDNYRIRLTQILGTNANNKVYLGYNNISKQEVAIKIVPKSQILSLYTNNLDAFKSQMKYLHTIKKTANYLVRYVNLLQTNNHFYFISEYCKDGDLKKKLKQKKVSFTQTFKYIRHILKGFIQLIKKGILHKNLKPKNILYHNGLMRISDFGLHNINQAKNIYQNVDNHLYQAPQVLMGKKYSYKSDIWSLGLIFYQLLYGTLPWKTGRVLKVYLQRLQNEPLIFPDQLQVSETLKQLISGCLKLKPQQRIQWSQIYYNSIFKDEFSLSFPQNYKFYYILSDLRKSLMESNLDLERYFQGKGILEQSQLKYKMFRQMLTTLSCSDNIHSVLSQDDIKYLFDSFDTNHNGVIEFSQFKKALEQFQVSQFTFQGKRKQKKKQLNLYNQNIVLDKTQKLNAFVDRIITSLKKQKIYDLYQLYIQNDQDLNGGLDFKEFVKMIQKLDRFATDQECRLLYQKLDQNGSNSISYSEFLKNMSILTGSPQKKAL